MVSSNEIYNLIDLEVALAISAARPLPQDFEIWFTELEFKALLAGGVHTNGVPVETTVTALRFEMYGRYVTIRSVKADDVRDWHFGLAPESW